MTLKSPIYFVHYLFHYRINSYFLNFLIFEISIFLFLFDLLASKYMFPLIFQLYLKIHLMINIKMLLHIVFVFLHVSTNFTLQITSLFVSFLAHELPKISILGNIKPIGNICRVFLILVVN